LDTVTLNSDLVIEKQFIGVVASGSSTGLAESFDGILGLGPVDLTNGTVSNTGEVPTVMDNLYSQGMISSEILGVFFSPTSSDNAYGELTFGDYDASKTVGDVSYAPITSTSPASRYWGIEQSISYGDTLILDETAGIVDTGATLILIATGKHIVYAD
jgi:saccharopepsin